MQYDGFYTLRSQKSLPVRSELKVPNNSVLLRRSNVKKEIMKRFSDRKDIATAVLVGIFGVGGCGKTTLARMCAQDYGYNHSKAIVFEINAETQETLVSAFKELAIALAQTSEQKRELRDIEQTKKSEEKEKRRLNFVKSRLKESPNWLLIYDNIDTLQDLTAYLPQNFQTWGTGGVIFTTRNSHIKNAEIIKACDVITLDTLSEQEALRLFVRICFQKEPEQLQSKLREKTRNLLKKIPNFPLDISVAARYIANQNITYDTYLGQLRPYNTGFATTHENFLKEVSEYTKTRNSIIVLALKRILDVNSVFLDFFVLVSLIGSQKIPLDLFKLQYPCPVINHFLYELKKYSLVVGQSTADNFPAISLHRSTQEIMLEYLLSQLTEEQKKTCFDKIMKTFEQYSELLIKNVNVSGMQRIFYHLLVFLNYKELLSLKNQSRTELVLGKLSCNLGDPIKAKNFLTESAKHFLMCDANESVSYIMSARTYIGIAEKSLGNFNRAKAILEQNIKSYDKTPGFKQSELGLALNALGYVYRSIEEYEHAKNVINRSIDIYKKCDPLNLSCAFSELASLLHFIGDYKGAVYYRLKSLKITSNIFKPDHIKNLHVKVWLSCDLVGDGKYIEALGVCNESYDIYQKIIPKNSEDMIRIATSLGGMYRALGLYQQAELLLLKGFEFSKKYFGLDHIRTYWSAYWLGRFYLETGNYQKAKNLLEKSAQGHIKYLGENNSKLGWMLHPLAVVYSHLGLYPNAKLCFERSLSFFEKKYGKEHIEYAMVLKDFGNLYILKKDYNKAEKIIASALSILEKHMHPECYKCYEYLGDLYIAQKKYNKIYPAYAKALMIVKQYFPRNSLHIVRLRSKIPFVRRFFCFNYY